MTSLRAMLVPLFLSLTALPVAAGTTTLNASTSNNASAWVITGAGATNAPAWQRGGEIALTSDAHNDGTFATGATLAQFDGVWWADLFFTLPAGATNPSLSFSNFKGDDKAVLMLNGIVIGDNGTSSFPAVTGTGLFAFPPGPPDQSYDYTGITDGTITSDFLPGQQNDLRIIINNTHGSTTDIHAKTFQGSGDATDATLTASISFDTPEPTSLLLLALPATLFLRRKRRPTEPVA